jgi:hypothetical protein
VRAEEKLTAFVELEAMTRKERRKTAFLDLTVE